MMHDQNISDESLNAFVDNELDSDEKNEIFDTIGRDEALKERVCELRSLKEVVQHAYQQPPAHRSSHLRKRSACRPPYQDMQRLAACVFLLLLGAGFGWLISNESESKIDLKLLNQFRAIQSNDTAEETGKIIVQVSNSNPVRLKTALDEAENLLDTYKRDHRQLKVEIIANGGGVDLLRKDVSPYGKRIGLMKAKYPNLDFLACSQTISKLQKKGVVVHLLPNIGVASSAADEINKRLLQGWDYVRI